MKASVEVKVKNTSHTPVVHKGRLIVEGNEVGQS